MAGTFGDLIEPGEEALFQQFLQQATKDQGIDLHQPQESPFHTVVPAAGFCLKTKTEKDEKTFINICTSETIPNAKDITEEELMKLLDSQDPTGFRVPMSLGEPHAEIDKGGKGCTAYDVIINPEFYKKTQDSGIFMGFLLTVTLEGLEAKYDMQLDRNYKILQNRTFFGALPEQNVRAKSKPLIMEMDDSTPSKPLISEIGSSEPTKEDRTLQAPAPVCTIIQDPPEGHPEFLVAEIEIPKVKSARTLLLDLGEDRVLLKTRSDVYYLDIYLPYSIVQDECGAQFNKKTKMLTITMPVYQER